MDDLDDLPPLFGAVMREAHSDLLVEVVRAATRGHHVVCAIVFCPDVEASHVGAMQIIAEANQPIIAEMLRKAADDYEAALGGVSTARLH